MLLILVGLISAAGWVFTKVALREISPSVFIAWRFLLAALVLLVFCWRTLLSFTPSMWRVSCIAGCFMACALSLWVEGMNQIENIGEAAFIVSLVVVCVPIINALLGQSMGWYLWLSLVPAVLGLYCLTGANGFALDQAQWLLLGAACLFSCHVVFSARYTQTIPSLSLTTVQLMMVACVSMAISVLQGTALNLFSERISSLGWSMFMCSALIATSLRFALQTKALALLPSEQTSMLSSLTPVFTALLGWAVLGERILPLNLLGCVLIFLAQPIYFYGRYASKGVSKTI